MAVSPSSFKTSDPSGWDPSEAGGGAGGVTPVSETLTPSAGVVSVAMDGTVVNGMLDGWRVVDAQSGLDSLADDGNALAVKIEHTTSDYEWLNSGDTPEKQPSLIFPTRLMGDFTFEVKFKAPSGDSLRHIFVGALALPTGGAGDTPDWNHHFGARFGRWNTTQGAPSAGICTINGNTRVTVTQQNWDQDNWLKIQRADETITASHKYGAGAYAPITTADKFDIGGGSTTLGIGFMSRAVDGAEDVFYILEVNITGFAYTATP